MEQSIFGVKRKPLKIVSRTAIALQLDASDSPLPLGEGPGVRVPRRGRPPCLPEGRGSGPLRNGTLTRPWAVAGGFWRVVPSGDARFGLFRQWENPEDGKKARHERQTPWQTLVDSGNKRQTP